MAPGLTQSVPRTALITGASSGIGAAFALEYARAGCNLILHAPPWEEAILTELSRTLADRHGVTTHTVMADLTDPQAPMQIFKEVSALNIDVNILVNCAGFVHYVPFQEDDWARHEGFLLVMVQAVCHMTHLFAPAMAEQKYGRIINVASISGLMPGLPGISLYGAAKAFLIKFSESLAAELALDGVHVTALCPGMTRTGLFAPAGLEKKLSHLPEIFWMDPERVAREGVEAAENNTSVYVNGWKNRLIIRLANALPKRLIRHAIVKREKRIRAKAQRQREARQVTK